MPELRNNWYNGHTTRRYPLDDKSTGIDDNGVKLKDDIIADLHLRYPSSAGAYAFLGGLTVAPNLVTAVFMAADDLDNPTKINAIAAVHATRPVRSGVNIAVRPLYEQVGGFIAFGDTSENFVGRFSTPRQGLLAWRAARSFDALPIPSLRRLSNAQGLQGLINVLGQSDVEVISDIRTIPEVGAVNALVIRLRQSTGSTANVLEKYIGPCGARPESRNCNKPPIENINGVVPDCDGNINIEFCRLVPALLSSCGGVLLDTSIGIDEVCATTEPEEFVGRDLCLPSSSSLSSYSSLSSGSVVMGFKALPEEQSTPITLSGPDLPYVDAFEGGTAKNFRVHAGRWDFTPVEKIGTELPGNTRQVSSSLSESSLSSSSEVWYEIHVLATETQALPSVEPTPMAYSCSARDVRNIAVWDAEAHASSIGKTVTTDLRLHQGHEENAGILVNWRLSDEFLMLKEQYFHVLLDRKANALRLMYFNGRSPLVEIAKTTLRQSARLEDWYRMEVSTKLLTETNVLIQAKVSGVSDPTWPTATLNVPTRRYTPDTGLFGLGSLRSPADFSFFSIQENT